MSDEVVKIIRVETGGSATTVRELKEEINSLRDALLNTEKGSEEYKEILNQLIEDQKKLTDVMRAGQKEATAAEGSYNALVNQMAALKKVWKETTDEVARKQLGKEINEINDKLKTMDASIGNFQRNVGNYAGSITEAFGSMGGAAKGMIGPINGVKTAFSALSKHPLVFVLTTLAALLINGIAKGFKSSEENTNKLRVAFSGFKAIGDAVLKLFQGLAGWIGKVAVAAVNFADKLGLITPKMKERQELTKKQIALEKQEREMTVKTAQLETEAAELREKASEAENYTIEQRIGFLKQAQEKETEQLELEKEILVQKAAQLEAQLALTQSTGAELDALNELKAKIIKVNAQIAQAQKKSNKEINALRRQGIQQAAQDRQQMLSLEKDLIQQEYDLAEDGSEEQLRLAKELRKKELDIQLDGFKTKIKNRKDYERAVKLAQEAFDADILKLEKTHARKEAQARMDEYSYNMLLGLREGSKEYYTALGQIAQKNLDEQKKLGKQEGETDAQFKQRLEDMRKEIQKNYDLGIQAADRETEVINQIILNGTRPMSAYYRTQFDQLKKYYDNMQKLESESPEEFAARQDEVWKAAIDALINNLKAGEEELKTFNDFELRVPTFKKAYSEIIELTANLKDKENELAGSRVTISEVIEEDLSNAVSKLQEYSKNRHPYSEDLLHGLLPTPETIEAILNRDKDYIIEKIPELGELSKKELAANLDQIYNDTLKALFMQGVIPQELINDYLASLKGFADAEKDILNYRYDNWNNLTTGIVSLTDNIADAYEADLKYAVEHNQKSEEVAKKEFETIKALRISAAIVDTIQGAIATFMGWQDKGQPWGAIIGAVQAAATLAAGWAQIRQIQMTKFGSSGSGGSVMLAQAQVTPSMPDYNPQMTGNLTGEQETENLANAIAANPIRAFVVESDISAAQQVANQRTSESTF